MATAAEIQAKMGELSGNMDKLDTIVNGDENATVATDGGVTPTVSKLFRTIRESLFKPPVAFASGLSATDGSFTVEKDGLVYAALPSETPFTTTGTFNEAQWFLVFGHFDFSDVADIKANAAMVYAAGSVLFARAEGFSFRVASSGASDFNMQADSGLKLYRVASLDEWVYVDKDAGDDSNDGLSEGAALQTLGAIPIRDGMRVRLVASSAAHWREEVDWSMYNDLTLEGWGDIVTYGLPKIDGTDVVTGSYDTSADRGDGLTDAYSVSWTHSITIGARNFTPCVFEGGEMLQFATSASNCNATPGTFWHDMPVTGAPVVIYIHPKGSTNPNSDGKLYEITKRHEVIRVGDRCKVSWVHAHAAGNTLGSIVHGHDCVIERYVVTGNPLHSINGGSGLRRHGGAHQPVAFPGEGGLIQEYYIEDGQQSTMRHERCISIGPASVGALDIAGFGGHDTGVEGWKRIEYIDCACYNATMDAGGADEVLVERANMVNGSMMFGVRSDGAKPEIMVVDPQMIVTDLATGGTARGYLMASTYSANKNTRMWVEGLRLYADVNWLAAFNGPSNLWLTNSAIKLGPNSAGGGGLMKMNSLIQKQNAVVNHNLIEGSAGYLLWDVRNYESNGGSLDSDFNVLYPQTGNGTNSMAYRGPDGSGGQLTRYQLADIQSDFGLEANSVAADPGFLDPANGDFRHTNDGGIPGVGLVRPHINYTPALTSEADLIEWVIYGEVL